MNSETNAQAGPGGVSNSTNVRLWLRAGEGVYTDAGTTLATNGLGVQQWNDLSGNGLNATNTSGAKPTYNTTTTLNGFPVLNFSGALLSSPIDISPTPTPNLTIMVVTAHNNASTTNSKLWGHDNGGFDRSIGFDSRGTTSFNYFTGGGVASINNPVANQYFITTANYTASTFSTWFNGTNLVNALGVANGAGQTSISIGSITAGAVEPWTGPIAEFIIFNKTLNEAERILAENYMAAKFGLTLNVNDLYTMDNPANGNYDYEVAGIGQSAAGANVTNAKGTGLLTLSNPSDLGNGEYLIFGHDNGLTTATSGNSPAAYTRMRRIWRASETGETGTTTLSFDLTGISNAPTIASNIFLLIDKNNNGDFTDETLAGGGIVANPAKTGNSYAYAGVNIADGQRFALAYTSIVPLPVAFTGITVHAGADHNLISWQTANEENIASFDVEKSSNGAEFYLTGSVNANNNNTSIDYVFTDKAPLSVSYYRIKVNNHDGSYQYSSVVKASNTGLSILKIAPNPAVNSTTISGLPSTANLQLIDAAGRVYYKTTTSESAYTLSLTNYPTGLYYLLVDIAGQQTYYKLIKN